MKTVHLLCVLLIAFGIAGCGVSSLNYSAPEDTQYQTYLETKNPGLVDRIAIIEVGHSDAGGLMRSQVGLKNRGSSEAHIQYKFRWFDKGGFEVSPEGSPWTPVSILGGDIIRIQGLAPNPSAKSFRVVIDK